MELIFNSGRRKGKVHKSALVRTNDSSAADVRIYFTAEAAGYPDTSFFLNITPPVLDFTPMKGKNRTKMATLIENTGKKRVKIKPVDYPKDLLKVKLSKDDLRSGEKAKLMVKLNRRMELDKFEKSITFELNDEHKTRFSIPVKKILTPEQRASQGPPPSRHKKR